MLIRWGKQGNGAETGWIFWENMPVGVPIILSPKKKSLLLCVNSNTKSIYPGCLNSRLLVLDSCGLCGWKYLSKLIQFMITVIPTSSPERNHNFSAQLLIAKVHKVTSGYLDITFKKKFQNINRARES